MNRRTATLPSARPVHTAHASYGTAQRQGTRTRQADAYAVLRDPITGRVAAVVADGIGDRDEPAWAAQVGADYAATVAVATGSPARAIRQARAHRNLRDLGCPDYDPTYDYWPDEGDTVLTVAVVEPGASAVRVAWVGDCRAYRVGHTDTVEQVTTDHTRGEQLRRLGVIGRDEPPCQADSIITSRLAHGPIGTATIPAELVRRLLLCSDGIGKQLDAEQIGINLVCADHPATAARWLADDAAEHPHSDNITAVVLDLPQRPAGHHW